MSGPAGYASIPRWVLHRSDLSSNAKMIYLCLSSFIGADEEAWPSLSTLATMSGISVSTVQRCLAELRDAGLVQWSGRVRPDGGQTSNLYRLETNPPSQVDQPPPVRGTTPPSHSDQRTYLRGTTSVERHLPTGNYQG